MRKSISETLIGKKVYIIIAVPTTFIGNYRMREISRKLVGMPCSFSCNQSNNTIIITNRTNSKLKIVTMITYDSLRGYRPDILLLDNSLMGCEKEEIMMEHRIFGCEMGILE